MTSTANGFDPIWEQKYREGHKMLAPFDTAVTFMFRHAPRDKARQDIRILEMGCGSASNLFFASQQGFQVAGIDASEAAIATAKERFTAEGLQGDLRVADFTKLPFADQFFDLVVDRGAMTCVDKDICRRGIAEITRVIKPGGRFLFTPFSDHHSSAVSGECLSQVPGSNAVGGFRGNICEGSLTGVGHICFYGAREVLDCFAPKDWRLLSMLHITQYDALSVQRCMDAEWQVVAERL